MIAAIIQARTKSTRLENKIFLPLAGKPLLWHVLNRLTPSRFIQKVIIATTTSSADDRVEEWCIENNFEIFRGSESDVLGRYYHAAKKIGASIVVRITADDPFKDYQVVDRVIEQFLKFKVDLCTNNCPPSYPEGLDVEVFSLDALGGAHLKSNDPFEREHVTQHFYRNREAFSVVNVQNDKNLSHHRWTIDNPEDYKMASAVYDALYAEKKMFSMDDILSLLEERPQIIDINRAVKRSHMYNNLAK